MRKIRKLRLDLDRLDVQSFAPVEDERTKRGTVHGHDSWLDPQSLSEDIRCVCPLIDSGPNTCYNTGCIH